MFRHKTNFKRKGNILLFLLTLLLNNQAFTQSQSLQKRIKEVENNLIPYVPVKGFKGWNLLDRMQYYKVPGVSIAVIKDYKVDWAKGYGWADTLKKIPVTTATLFSAGSISKFLMAVTALKLVEMGKLALDSPINNYLRSWKLAENNFTQKTPVTLRMLLSHSAGTTQSSYFGFTPDKQPLPTVVEILSGAAIAETRAVVVNSEPNKEFRYSGGGSMIAQMALMDVTGNRFSDLTQQLLFGPLGMSNSTFEQPLPKKFLDQSSWAYSEAPWFKGMPYVYPQQAAAGLYSTPSDLAAFFIDIQKSYLGKGTVLSEPMVKKMLTAQVNVSDGSYKEQMGIGPFLIQQNGNKDSGGIYFEFTGVNAGFLAYGIASITGGNGAVIMLNSGDDVNGLGKEIRRAIAKTYHWTAFLPEEIRPLKLSTADLNQFAGRYRKAPDEVVYIRKEKTYLIETINEGNDIYCFPVLKDTVVFTDFNVKGGFKRNHQKEVVSLQLQGQENPMPKMKANEFSPSEYLRMKKYDKAKAAFRDLKMNEYQITYLAYDLLNKKSLDLDAVKTVLELAAEQHPDASIVYSRWGDYYLKQNDKSNAIKNYQKALSLDSTDSQTRDLLNNLLK